MISSQLELKPLLYALVLLSSYSLSGNAQDQIGFISIDCGLRGNFSSYKEETTGINYVSDEKFINTGESRSVTQKYIDEYQQPYLSVRSFPEGNRNCYRIDVIKGTKYLIRASFVYGDYDGQGMPPSFDLYLGPNFWDSIESDDSSTLDDDKEIVYVTHQNYVHICLVSTGRGVPFVSAIELRPLNDSVYYTQMGSLKLFVRRDVGSSEGYRFGNGDDVHDRLWTSMSHDGWRSVNTSQIVESKDPDDHFDVPSIVMSTAATPEDPKANLDIYWTNTDNITSRYYFFMHFAEVKQLAASESREFNIYYNGVFFHGPISPSYLRRTTVVAQTSLSGLSHNFSISMTKSSTLPPIINAFETYTIEEFPQLESDQQDVDAVTKLKSTYGLRKNWQGDPCRPKEYSWEGLKCSYNEGPPRVISLNLSSSTLTGEIAPSIANLSMIEDLDLSNNIITGSIPDFLSQLSNLKILNLEHNQLYGSVPIELIEKRNKGFLLLSVKGNENLCASVSCYKKKTGVLVVAISVAGTCVLLLVVAATCWALRRKTPRVGVAKAKAKFAFGSYSIGTRKRKFRYSDIVKITKNFEKVIGKGGFGIVYHGHIDDTQVAVKMLSSGVQGYQQFEAEVDILLRVYHKNLTTLLGYFTDAKHFGLVYEYMANGDLQSHLLEASSTSTNLKWEDRIRIAVDTAQGLEYLHHGCKPPIVHRDVKPANILLNESFQAKLSDFGISKTFPSDSKATHVSTVIAGTPGYLDPEYHKTNRLNEKSDVYSFGVLLMEIITGRPAMSRSHIYAHVSEWVTLMLMKGLIRSIIDPRLQENFNLNSAWKVVELAMNCVASSSANRPNMGQVVAQLKVCLEMTQVSQEDTERELSEVIPSNFITEHMRIQPLVR